MVYSIKNGNMYSMCMSNDNVFRSLKLLYDVKLYIHQIWIYETRGAGSVSSISTYHPDTNEAVELWKADEVNPMTCSRVFAPPLNVRSYPFIIFTLPYHFWTCDLTFSR